MTVRRSSFLMALTMALSVAAAAHAEQFGIDKGKAAASPCSLVWDSGDGTTTTAKGKKRIVQCADGSACDQDGAANGSCTFSVNVCTGAEIAGCTPQPVELIKPAAKAKKLAGLVLPPVGGAPACGTAGTISIPLKGKQKNKPSALGKGKLLLKTKTASGKGAAALFLQCIPGDGEPIGPPVCPDREASGLPKQVNLTVPTTGGDLDNGQSGDSHNFPVTAQSTLSFCLTNCDATTDSTCDGSGSTGPKGQSLNGPLFGAPLPLLSNNVPVCVVNRYANPTLTATYDLATGEMSGVVNLLSDVYVQTADGTGDNVCPRCSGASLGATGTCQAGVRKGQSCTVDGTITVVGSGGSPNYNLSTECLPDANKLAATLVIDLPLTTGESRKDGSKPCPGQVVDDACPGGGTCTFDCSGTQPAKGGINQTCCSNAPSKPCFPTAPDSPPGAIIRNGTPAVAQPAWPDPAYPKMAEGGRNAAVFCIARTNDSTVDILTGLPGPGALLLPYSTEILGTP